MKDDVWFYFLIHEFNFCSFLISKKKLFICLDKFKTLKFDITLFGFRP